MIPYNDAEALAKVLDEHPHVAGFLVEPIQEKQVLMYPMRDI